MSDSWLAYFVKSRGKILEIENVALWADGTFKVTRRQRYMAGCIGIADSPTKGVRIRQLTGFLPVACPTLCGWLRNVITCSKHANERLHLVHVPIRPHAACTLFKHLHVNHSLRSSSCPNAFNKPLSFNFWYQQLFFYSNEFFEFFLIHCRHDWIDYMRANINNRQWCVRLTHDFLSLNFVSVQLSSFKSLIHPWSSLPSRWDRKLGSPPR